MEEKIKKILSEELEISIDKINLKTNLKEDLSIDSIDMMQLIDVFEEKFNIKIDYSDINKIKKFEDLVEYIKNKK